EDDIYSLRHAIWLATDRAYKQAVAGYALKQSMLHRFQTEQKTDDFSQVQPATHIGELATLDLGRQKWSQVVTRMSSLYKVDTKLESFVATLKFNATNEYFVNSEGTMLRQGRASYGIDVTGSAQADDGTRVNRNYGEITPTLQEFPKMEKMENETKKVVALLGQLRAAPAVTDDYQGPVLLLNRAADDLVAEVVAKNVVGIPPDPGSSARTRGDYAQSYKTRIFPAFVSIVDDPSLKVFKTEGLLSNYEYDDEGVKAQKLAVVDNG